MPYNKSREIYFKIKENNLKKTLICAYLFTYVTKNYTITSCLMKLPRNIKIAAALFGEQTLRAW
jgi:hypothetical protein